MSNSDNKWKLDCADQKRMTLFVKSESIHRRLLIVNNNWHEFDGFIIQIFERRAVGLVVV